MRWRRLTRKVGVMGVMGLAWGAPVQAAESEDAVPGVVAVVDTTATTVGGRVRLTLEIDTPSGWFVTLPEKMSEMGSFRVRSTAEVGRTEGHRRVEYTLVATEAGEVEIPPITLRATQGREADGIEFASQPIRVLVTSNLLGDELAAPGGLPASGGEAAPGGQAAPPGHDRAPALDGPSGAPASEEPLLADLKPALAPPRRWLPVAIAGALALLAGVAAFLALRWYRARGFADADTQDASVVARRPSWEIALEELDAVVEARWVHRGLPARQYDEVSEILRRYLENRFGIPALESTTEDLRPILREAPIRGDLASRVLSLLGEADLIKFAKGVPDPSDATSTERRVREIVRDTTLLSEDRPDRENGDGPIGHNGREEAA